MRQHHHLCAGLPAPVNLVNRMAAPETVHASERVVEHNDLIGSVSVLLQLGKEEGERERAPVAAAQRVLETRPVGRRRRVPEIDGVLIDDDLIARAGRASAISMRGRRNPEARIDALQIPVDPLAVLRDDMLRMGIELLPCCRFIGLQRCFSRLKAHIGIA